MGIARRPQGDGLRMAPGHIREEREGEKNSK